MQKETISTLKDLARYSTNNAVQVLNIVTDAEWKVLFGFKVSMLYQLLSVACVKATVQNIHDGVQTVSVSLKNAAAAAGAASPSLLASSRNRVRCDLVSAAKWREGGFD